MYTSYLNTIEVPCIWHRDDNWYHSNAGIT